MASAFCEDEESKPIRRNTKQGQYVVSHYSWLCKFVYLLQLLLLPSRIMALQRTNNIAVLTQSSSIRNISNKRPAYQNWNDRMSGKRVAFLPIDRGDDDITRIRGGSSPPSSGENSYEHETGEEANKNMRGDNYVYSLPTRRDIRARRYAHEKEDRSINIEHTIADASNNNGADMGNYEYAQLERGRIHNNIRNGASAFNRDGQSRSHINYDERYPKNEQRPISTGTLMGSHFHNDPQQQPVSTARETYESKYYRKPVHVLNDANKSVDASIGTQVSETMNLEVKAPPPPLPHPPTFVRPNPHPPPPLSRPPPPPLRSVGVNHNQNEQAGHSRLSAVNVDKKTDVANIDEHAEKQQDPIDTNVDEQIRYKGDRAEVNSHSYSRSQTELEISKNVQNFESMIGKTHPIIVEQEDEASHSISLDNVISNESSIQCETMINGDNNSVRNTTGTVAEAELASSVPNLNISCLEMNKAGGIIDKEPEKNNIDITVEATQDDDCNNDGLSNEQSVEPSSGADHCEHEKDEDNDKDVDVSLDKAMDIDSPEMMKLQRSLLEKSMNDIMGPNSIVGMKPKSMTLRMFQSMAKMSKSVVKSMWDVSAMMLVFNSNSATRGPDVSSMPLRLNLSIIIPISATTDGTPWASEDQWISHTMAMFTLYFDLWSINIPEMGSQGAHMKFGAKEDSKIARVSELVTPPRNGWDIGTKLNHAESILVSSFISNAITSAVLNETILNSILPAVYSHIDNYRNMDAPTAKSPPVKLKREKTVITKTKKVHQTILSQIDTEEDLDDIDFARLLVELQGGPLEEIIEEVEYEYDLEPIFEDECIVEEIEIEHEYSYKEGKHNNANDKECSDDAVEITDAEESTTITFDTDSEDDDEEDLLEDDDLEVLESARFYESDWFGSDEDEDSF